MAETPGVSQNQTPTPLDPIDVAALSAELRNPATSHERVEEILGIAQGAQMGEATPPSDARENNRPYWQTLDNAQLADMLIDPNVAPELKDAISQFVISRDQPQPSDKQ